MLNNEATIAATSTNQEEALKQADAATPMTMAAQSQGLASGVGGSSADQESAMRMMMGAAPPSANRDITASGNGYIPKPWVRFEDALAKIDPALIKPMIQAGFATPTAIQSYAWPIGVEGRDMIGVAKTGSGKTLGFLLPAFAKILQERIRGSPLMLVLAPTRELAVQIDQDAKKFLSHAGVTTALAYGGAPKGDQLREFRNQPMLLTATPGRLNDFIEQRSVSLRDIRYAA
jgi:ATP-dependent RNA helicase DDX5/DBP2